MPSGDKTFVSPLPVDHCHASYHHFLRTRLGSNLKLGLSRLVEFKAALDRMRGLTWVYMEAAASAGKLPAQCIPQAFKEFLQQRATRTQAIHTDKKIG